MRTTEEIQERIKDLQTQILEEWEVYNKLIDKDNIAGANCVLDVIANLLAQTNTLIWVLDDD